MIKDIIELPAATTPDTHPWDTFLDRFLREFARFHCDPWDDIRAADWYGVLHRDDHVTMTPYSEGMDPWEPNFYYKPLEYKVWWYKNIGRSTRVNRILTGEEFEAMRRDLLCLSR